MYFKTEKQAKELTMTLCEKHVFVEFFCLKIDFKGSKIFKNYARITIAALHAIATKCFKFS